MYTTSAICIQYIQYILTTLIYFKRLPTSCKGGRIVVFVSFFLAESQSTLSAFLLHGLIYFIRVTSIVFKVTQQAKQQKQIVRPKIQPSSALPPRPLHILLTRSFSLVT